MVSVCLATYNGEQYLLQQLTSILLQLSPLDEIVISDDGSTDGTLQIVSELKDPRIKVFLNEGKHGVVPNFENALRHATGDVIFLCDQDDIWLGHKVDRCVKALEEADLVVHNALLMDGQGRVSDKDYFTLRGSRAGYWKNLYKNSFIGCCMAFRKDVLSLVLPFPKHILWHDMWIGLVVSKRGRTLFIDDPLLYYRRHGANASQTGERSSFSLKKKVTYRLQMWWYTMFGV